MNDEQQKRYHVALVLLDRESERLTSEVYEADDVETDTRARVDADGLLGEAVVSEVRVCLLGARKVRRERHAQPLRSAAAVKLALQRGETVVCLYGGSAAPGEHAQRADVLDARAVRGNPGALRVLTERAGQRAWVEPRQCWSEPVQERSPNKSEEDAG